MSRTRRNLRHHMCLFLCATAALLSGQPQPGEIRIQVQDSSGLAMEASGKLESLASKTDLSFQTDPQGTYTFSNLSSGRYRLEVSKAGFATQSVLIDVQSGDARLAHGDDGARDAGFQDRCGRGDSASRNGPADRPDSGTGPDGQRARPGAERRARSFRSAESAPEWRSTSTKIRRILTSPT